MFKTKYTGSILQNILAVNSKNKLVLSGASALTSGCENKPAFYFHLPIWYSKSENENLSLRVRT